MNCGSWPLYILFINYKFYYLFYLFIHPCLFQLAKGEVLTLARRQVVLLFRNERKGIDLIEDHDHRLRFAADLGKCSVDHFDLLFEHRMRNIDHVQEQIGLAHFIEGRFERFDEFDRQLADESDRIGQ